MIAIVVSRADVASERIGEALLEVATWNEETDRDRPDGEGGGPVYGREGFELRTFDDLHLEIEDVADAFTDPDLVVFVSRHAGDTGPLLTAHFTGNAGAAEFGGEDGRLAEAAPNAHASVLDALSRHAPAGYDVGTECTHHGPSTAGAPSMFVEVGSAEAQWRDDDAARAVARAVLDLDGVDPVGARTVVGFGGGHYAPRFERVARETGWAVGHVLSDWGLEAMADLSGDRRRDVLRQAFERSATTRAVLDGEHPDLATTIGDLGYGVVSETWVRETSDVPLDLVDRLESALAPVDDGLRFGEAAKAWNGGDVAVYRPDPELLADAAGVDPQRARGAVSAHALGYETAEGGTRVDGRVALAPGAVDPLIDELAAVLADRFTAVERRDDELVATERRFDPQRARELGVPEGPAFGRLSGGETVEVDGEPVSPEEVHVERTRRYRL